MEGNFVADVRLDDSDEVLQLPIVKNRLKKLLQSAVKKIALLGAPVIPSSDDSLEQFLQSAGRFFGKDCSKWEQCGEPTVEYTEEGGKCYTKSTGVFSGVELHLFVEEPYYDDRLPIREEKPELNFHEKRRAIKTDEEWQMAIGDQPWSASKRRQMVSAYLHAKLEADDGELAVEGCHGLWELSINKDNHADIRLDRLASLLTKLSSNNIAVATTAAAAVWGLATTAGSRRNLAELDVVPMTISALKKTLKLVALSEQQLHDGEAGVPEGAVSDVARGQLQRHLLGGLAVLLIDRFCRRPYLALEPDFSTLFTLCKNLEGYPPLDAQQRRETSAKVLTSLIQRDGEARKSLISSGALRSVIVLLNPQGPGSDMIQFCMASLLATMVLDDDAMELIRDRNEAPLLFEACIVLLTSTLDKLHAELDRQLGGYYEEGQPLEYDLALGVRLAEAASQAMWGSAHYCVAMSPIQIKMEHVVELGKMGMDCVATDQLPLSRVCHCVTATLATLASNPESAELIMTCPDDLALKTLMTLVEVFETENFERAGHVKASACAGIAFLACHPIGADGDDCMHGPYRTKLLEMGGFGALLRAALTSVLDPECDMIVQQAAAIGVMYLSTMAGGVDAAELAMYAALLMDSDNSEMIEFLMAGMWILLRNPENRRVLGSNFSPNPASKVSKQMMSKLNDAITLHEIHDQAQEKAAMIRTVFDSGNGPEEGSVDGQQEGGDVEDHRNLEDHDGSGFNDPRTSQSGASLASPRQGAVDGLDARRASNRHASTSLAGNEPGRRQSLPGAAAPSSNGSAHNTPRAHGHHSVAHSSSQVQLAGLHADSSSSSSASSRVNVAGPRDPQQGFGRPMEDPSALNSTENLRREAKTATQELRGKMQQLEKRFDKQLKDNWGLETLVAVGESWLPAMLEQDQLGNASDIPVLKLFEFLVASICLFMIEDDAPPERRELDLFKLTAPTGVRNKTWWTVDAHAPEPDPIVEEQLERALAILLQIIGMRLGPAWKSLQLGVLTLWNACARNGNMERHVVERGVCVRLLDIVNNGNWPPSLRDIAGGCMEFFIERYSNLRYLPEIMLPEDLPWPLPKPPTHGVIPAMAGFINLINSRFPLLEYRGCHGIARICYSAPYGAPDVKEFLKETKSVAALLGAVDSVFALLKRVNKRYQDLTSSKPLLTKALSRKQRQDSTPALPPGTFAAAAAAAALDDDSEKFEKNMATIEATQDVYFVLFASLMNISLLRSVQPMVAKKGLLTLLGTNTMLYSRSAAIGKPSIADEKLMHLCGSIIQNISMHPQNRTRLYKAELKGIMNLDKLIEAATEIDDELRKTAELLPPLTQATSPRQRAQGPGTLTSPRKKTIANRQQRLSPNGGVLNASVDSVLASEIRPKVVFPPIVETKEGVWPMRNEDPQKSPSPDKMNRRMTNNGRTTGVRRADMRSSVEGGLADDGQEDEDINDSRNRFLNWLDNTFQDNADGVSSAPFAGKDEGTKKTFRKHLWDENGDWLETEPESAKSLHKLLCRPLNHLWNESPEARGRHGQARWEPAVSEYREASATVPLTRSAARLLATKPPQDELALMTAATQMMDSGRYDGENGDLEDVLPQRPPTRERQNGRVGLTVLQPNPDVTVTLEQPSSPLHDGGSRPRSNSGGNPKGTIPLKVCMGPQRARQVISFEDRILVNDDQTRPMLTMFEHVDGARVCNGLFPAYQLPNGKQAFMYYNGGSLLDEVHVDAVVPPPRPSTVPQALQQTMPLADVLNLIAKPPGSAPPFIPYKPVPYLVPLPSHHTLTVKHPDVFSASAFGDLREDNIQLIIQAKKIIKTQTTTRVEAIELKPVDEREPWQLPTSIFKPRVKECDARGFFDTAQVQEKMFERDWQRACAKEKFAGMLSRENKANKTAPKDDKTMLKEVHDVLLQYYQQWYSAFEYFAAGGSGDPYHMSLNAYTTFLDVCQIADPESQYIKRSDCDTIFIVCNFQPDKKSAEAQVNVENAMMRYEFVESIVRAAIAKYGKGQATDDVVEAVRLLLESNIVPNLPGGANMVSNDFRQQRLYTEEVDLLLKRHHPMLKALYSRYRLKPPGGGLRTKVMKLEGWLQLMGDAHLIDSQFTIQDANLAFLWSRMYTVDEIKDYTKYTSITFVDFLEALGRVADMKSLPLDSDLEIAGYNNVLDWALDKERFEGSEQSSNDQHAMDLFRVRESAGFNAPRRRPLYMKLEMLLDLIFRRLYWDPVNQDNSFNYDGLLKLIKKIDKDLGP